MFSEQALVTRIASQTGYTVKLADETQGDLITEDIVTPKVYVGHIGIHLQIPNNLWADGYQELDNPQLLLTEINFLCLRVDLATVRTNIYNAYSTFAPEPNDPSFSHLTLVNAQLIGRTGTKVWWKETVGMIFPRIL